MYPAVRLLACLYFIHRSSLEGFMHSQSIDQVLQAFIRDEFMGGDPAATLPNDRSLIQDGLLDSLGIFILVGFIEERWRISLKPEDIVLSNFETIAAIQSLIALRQVTAE